MREPPSCSFLDCSKHIALEIRLFLQLMEYLVLLYPRSVEVPRVCSKEESIVTLAQFGKAMSILSIHSAREHYPPGVRSRMQGSPSCFFTSSQGYEFLGDKYLQLVFRICKPLPCGQALKAFLKSSWSERYSCGFTLCYFILKRSESGF